MHGRRKMTRHLRRQGHDVALCTVDRSMREIGLNGVVRGRKHRTTIPAKDGVRAGDRLNRDFTTSPQPCVGGGFHLRLDMDRLAVCRVSVRRPLPCDRGLDHRGHQDHRTGGPKRSTWPYDGVTITGTRSGPD